MFNSLQDILDAEPANELIAPFDLTEADVVGSELVPIVTMGIFNPMGPTIIALNLLTKRDADSAGILCTVLNPFTQNRQVFARCGNDPISLTSFLPNANRIGESLLLGAYPDFVLPSTELEPIVDAVKQLTYELVSYIPSRDDLSETTAKIKKHWKDPWSRIPSMEGMMQEAISGQGAEPVAHQPSESDFREWFSTVSEQEHWTAEIGAVIQAWTGAIDFQGGGLPHMPLDEAVSELASLAHPLFQALRNQLA